VKRRDDVEAELSGAKTSSSGRENLGRRHPGVAFPSAPPRSETVNDPAYGELRDLIVERIGRLRLDTVMRANVAMIVLYWQIGRDILDRQQREGWGARVIDRLSADIADAYPELGGFSPRNLNYMRRFAQVWPDLDVVQRVAAQIPWRANMILLDKLDDPSDRLWYAEKMVVNGWSSNVLGLMISSQLMQRQGKAVTNFTGTFPPAGSDLATQVFKDPYLFDFLGTDGARREVEVERSLVAHMEKFLMELGRGFAFVGRQVRLELGDQDFYVDLLFYHLELRCFVVVELKTGQFEPGFVGQLSMYQSVVDDVLRHADDKPTIGLLLVKGKDETVVRYALSGFTSPIGVAQWQEQLAQSLPDDLKPSLPTIQEIENSLTNPPAES